MTKSFWRSKKERNIFVICTIILFFIGFFIVYHARNIFKEDVDGDGIKETIIEERHPDESYAHWVIEEDGTIYHTFYNTRGEVANKGKIIPPENEGEENEIHVWDRESGEWLPDQNRNGIPDEEEQNNSNKINLNEKIEYGDR